MSFKIPGDSVACDGEQFMCRLEPPEMRMLLIRHPRVRDSEESTPSGQSCRFMDVVKTA
jgi:hypothetical protein